MFNPVRHYNWLIYRLVNPALRMRLKKYAKGRLLDIGCGEKPYLEMATAYVQAHVGLDHEGTLHDKRKVDLFGTAYNIPVEPSSFDTILCTYVLEHLEEPQKAIAEAYRVLKKGGFAIYTVPLFWHLHEEPRDFYRFTKYGLTYIFESNGFRVLECKALTGFFVMVAQETTYYLLRFRRGGRINPLWWIVPPINVVIQMIAYLLNFIDRSESFTMEYILVAQKPD
ncbi:MAG: class I SAM-dependent methyltransferase [Bacteroidota bacterium]